MMEVITEFKQWQSKVNAKMNSLTKEIANLKIKYANMKSPAVFELNDYEDELLKVEDKISAIQQDIVQITTDVVDLSKKL